MPTYIRNRVQDFIFFFFCCDVDFTFHSLVPYLIFGTQSGSDLFSGWTEFDESFFFLSFSCLFFFFDVVYSIWFLCIPLVYGIKFQSFAQFPFLPIHMYFWTLTCCDSLYDRCCQHSGGISYSAVSWPDFCLWICYWNKAKTVHHSIISVSAIIWRVNHFQLSF